MRSEFRWRCCLQEIYSGLTRLQFWQRAESVLRHVSGMLEAGAHREHDTRLLLEHRRTDTGARKTFRDLSLIPFSKEKRETSSELKWGKMTNEKFLQKLSVSYPSLENLWSFLRTKPLSGSQASAVVGFSSSVPFLFFRSKWELSIWWWGRVEGACGG